MSDYLLQQGTRRTDQGTQARPDQVPNSAGGFVWAVDDWTRLRRFLILGSEGGSYYASQRDLTIENVTSVRKCIADDGVRTVNEIVAISDGGRAAKNDPALYALAACFSLGDYETRLAAGKALPKVARMSTHLYHFIAYMKTMRGWGRMARKAVSEWYETKPIEKVAYQAVKYRQRDGWSHRDLLRLAHPDGNTGANAPNEWNALYAWITKGGDAPESDTLAMLTAFEAAQNAQTPAMTAVLIREYGLPREAVKPEHLNDLGVWQALIDVGMPIGAMIRNLATMTRNGLLTPTSDATREVLITLDSEDALRRARIHPIQVLMATTTYSSGVSLRGSNTWTPLPQIVDALDGAFYKSFGNVESTGKRTLLALDVSGSMTGQPWVAGCPGLDPRTAAAAMALVTAKTEQAYECVGFWAGNGGRQYGGRATWGRNGITPIPLSSRQRLDDVVKLTSGLPFGATDCALPMIWAHEEKKEFDTFIVYTDAETWFGDVHPFQALRAYREQWVPDAKLVCVGMVSNGFTIADPSDAGMLDVVGMDTATPNLISEFSAGRL